MSKKYFSNCKVFNQVQNVDCENNNVGKTDVKNSKSVDNQVVINSIFQTIENTVYQTVKNSKILGKSMSKQKQ